MDRSDDELLRATLAAVAPGTELRDGLERILRGRTGALIVLGYDSVVDSICTGGFVLDVEFSRHPAARAGQDGRRDRPRPRGHPHPARRHPARARPRSRPTESGTRHRTAERVAKQTGFPVISVSQSMRIVALYVGGLRHVLEGSTAILSRANQALQTLERYKARLDEVTGTLSALEIEDLVTVRDVAAVAPAPRDGAPDLATRSHDYVVELGTDGRLLTPAARGAHRRPRQRPRARHPRLPRRRPQPALSVEEALDDLQDLDAAELLDLAAGARAVGFSIVGDALDAAGQPRRATAC